MRLISKIFAVVSMLIALGSVALAQPGGPQPPVGPWLYAAPQIYSPAGSCVTMPQTVTGGCVAPNSINIAGNLYLNGVAVNPISSVTNPLRYAAGVLSLSFNSSLALDGGNNLGINLANPNIFSAVQTVDLGSGSSEPALLTGNGFVVFGADGVSARFDVTAFNNSVSGVAATFDGRTSLGTRTSPAAVTSGTILAQFQGKGYDTTSFNGTGAALRIYAEGTFTPTSHPGEACLATIPASSTTIADQLCVHDDGGVTVGSVGSEGFGTLNLNGNLYKSGTQAAIRINSTSCPLFGSCAITATAASVTVGATTVLSGTSGQVLYDNAGALGEATITGSLGSVVLSVSPTFTGTVTVSALTTTGTVTMAPTVSINGNTASVPAFGSWFTAQQFVINNQNGTTRNGIAIFNYGGGPGSLTLLSAAGTGASPTATQGSQDLGRMEGWGFDGTNYQIGAYVSFSSTQIFTSAHLGSQISFFTTPNNSMTNTLAMTIGQNQSVTVAGTVSASNLSLGGTLTTSAALTTTGAGTPTLAFPSSGFTYTFPGAAANLAYQATSFVNGHCLQASGTAGGIADAGSACGSGGSTTITANSTPTSGFSAGQMVYSDGSLAQASTGITYNGTGQVTFGLGTITTNLKALNITGTFNAGGTTFDAPLFMNITNTASAAGSNIADWQIGGTSVFQMDANTGTAQFSPPTPGTQLTNGGLLLNFSGLALANLPATAHYASFVAYGDGNNHAAGHYAYTFGTARSIFVGYNIGGTPSSPTATQSGSEMTRIDGRGFVGASFSTGFVGTSAAISLIAGQNFATNANAGWIGFRTTALNTAAGDTAGGPPVVAGVTPSGGMFVGAANVTYSGQNTTTLGTDPGANNLLLFGNLQLQGSSSGTATLQAPATGGGTATLFAGSDTVAGKTVANGGTNCSSASGTCLDNITGFSSTGFIKRTGAGAYTFTADPSDVTSVSNSDGTLTISPTTGAVVASIALGHANTWTASQTISGASFALSGNISAAAWTTAGVRYANVAGTLTDTSSTGTVAAAYTSVFGGDTIAASSATVYTNYIGAYFKNPLAGTNVTITDGPATSNGYALGADSLIVQAPGATGLSSSMIFFGQTATSGSESNTMSNDTNAGTSSMSVINSAGAGTTLINVANSTVVRNNGTTGGGLYLGSTKNFPVILFQGGNVTATNISINIVSPTNIQFPHTPSDAGKTDTAACLDSTTFQLYTGSGTLGVCLGTSSERYKHGIANLNVGLNEIMGLRPVSYYPNEGHGDPNKMLYGFTAEQGVAVLPQLAGLDDHGRPNTFDYLGVVPVLVRAVQELKADNDNLRAELKVAIGTR